MVIREYVTLKGYESIIESDDYTIRLIVTVRGEFDKPVIVTFPVVRDAIIYEDKMAAHEEKHKLDEMASENPEEFFGNVATLLRKYENYVIAITHHNGFVERVELGRLKGDLICEEGCCDG